MAKRRIVKPENEEDEKTQEERKPAFKPPIFDETEFLQTENRSAKLIYISLGVAVVAGIFTFGLMTLLHTLGSDQKFTIPIIVPVIFAFVTIFLFGKFGIDIKALEWKKWLENGFMFIMAWFAIWLLTMNPPFSDFSDPLISEPLIEVEVEPESTIHYLGGRMFIDDRPVPETDNAFKDISSLEDVSRIRVYSMITDNWKLDESDVKFQYMDNTETWNNIFMEDSLNLTIGRFNDKLDIPSNVSKALDDEWLIVNDDIRSEYMYIVSFSPKNLTGLENVNIDDRVPMRIIFTARDSRGNSAEEMVPLELKLVMV